MTKRALRSVPFSAAATEASRWLARRDAGWSPAEQLGFEQWLAADPAHADAWTDALAAWDAFDRPHAAGDAEAMIEQLAARRHRRRWCASWGVTFALAAACVALVLVNADSGSWHRSVSPVADILVRPAVQTLPDGTSVELNAGAAISVEYTVNRRFVRLERGEAHFVVTKDSLRPFIVSAGGVEVRAVGTAFAVKLARDVIDVLVTEGRVAVARHPPELAPVAAEMTRESAAAAVLLDAGHRLSVPTPPTDALLPLHTEPADAADIAQRLAWRGPRLELAETPLADAVAVFNRENRLQITLRDAPLRALRLNGVFRADNADGFVRLLEANYGIRAEWHGREAVTLRGAP